jgi:hypothetical protein
LGKENKNKILLPTEPPEVRKDTSLVPPKKMMPTDPAEARKAAVPRGPRVWVVVRAESVPDESVPAEAGARIRPRNSTAMIPAIAT